MYSSLIFSSRAVTLVGVGGVVRLSAVNKTARSPDLEILLIL